MGCGCGGSGKTGSSVLPTFQVRYADGQTRNYLTLAEAQAAVEASAGTSNPGTLAVPT